MSTDGWDNLIILGIVFLIIVIHIMTIAHTEHKLDISFDDHIMPRMTIEITFHNGVSAVYSDVISVYKMYPTLRKRRYILVISPSDIGQSRNETLEFWYRDVKFISRVDVSYKN